MLFQNKKLQKIISIFLVVTFLCPVLLFTPTKKSTAYGIDSIGGVAGIISSILDGISNAYSKLAAAAQVYLENKEAVLDGLAWTAAKLVIRRMTTSIVEWINNGFSSDGPAFMTDLGSFMEGIGTDTLNDFIDSEELGFLCDSFSSDIKVSLKIAFSEEESYECTVDGIVDAQKDSLQNLKDDWNWKTWIEMTNNSNNNVYGAFLKAEADVLKEISNKQEEEKTKLGWGDGFFSWEEESCVTTDVREICTTKIMTPGRVISDQLNHTLGLGQDSLVTADEINEIIGSLLDALITNIMSSGEHGLYGQDMNSDVYNTAEDFDTMKNSVTKMVNGSLDIEREYLKLRQAAKNVIDAVITKIKELITCLESTGEEAKKASAEGFLTGIRLIPNENIWINLPSLEDTANTDVTTATENIQALEALIAAVDSATEASVLTTIMEQYSELDLHDFQDLSDANLALNGYGADNTQYNTGLDNGIIYDANLLLTAKPSLYNNYIVNGIVIYVAKEKEKGIDLRLSECTACKANSANCLEFHE